jgi:hypothetical protein
MKLIFDLENENGFFSVYFFMVSTFIFARKNNKVLYIKDNKWKFLYKNGYDDYFILNENIMKYEDDNKEVLIFKHMQEPNIQYTLNDYKYYIKILYKINPEIIQSFNLPEKYNSIFIRGGDKLLYESKKYHVSNYISLIIKLNTNTNNIFIHSDDNLLVEEVEQYIKQNNIDLNIYKITNNNCNGGAVIMKRLKYNSCKNIKSVDEMNNQEIKEHTILFLNAIEIMKKSENVVLSYDSNVSRFMKLYFDCNVYSINHTNNLNYNIPCKNPAYSF